MSLKNVGLKLKMLSILTTLIRSKKWAGHVLVLSGQVVMLVSSLQRHKHKRKKIKLRNYRFSLPLSGDKLTA